MRAREESPAPRPAVSNLPATIMEPELTRLVLESVLVNNRFAVDDGKPTGDLSGAALDR